MSKKTSRCESLRKFQALGRQISYVALLAIMGLPFLVHSTPGLVLEEVSFRQIVTTPTGTALGGAVDLTLRSDGTYKAHFHMHDSGAIDYDFVVRAVFSASNGTAFALQHSGHVEGTESTTLTRGPRRNSDKDITGFHQLLRDNWPAVKAGKMSVSKDYSKAGVVGFIEDISKTIVEITGGAARGAAGAVIALGDEMVKTFESLEQSGTISVIAGVAVIASGGGAVMAVTTGVKAGLVTKALIKNRPLTAEEYNFANVVFNGTLPPPQDIILTNLEGIGGRAFVMPGVGSKIYVNIGAYGYERPMTHLRSVDDNPGRLFIHELTHVWQIHHKKFVPGWVCSGLISQVGNTFSDAYDYRSKGFLPWTEFNIEEQSSLVDEWFGRRQTRAADKMNPEDPTDPYFRYIRDNVRGAITAMAVTPPRSSVRNDFNNDSNADILWHNASSGEIQIWHMSGSSRVSRATVIDEANRVAPIGPPWRIVGSRDFNNDGSTDVLWHNSSTNETQLWYLNKAARVHRATVLDEGAQPIFVGPPWSIVATAPGQIIWHNSASGETQIWRMNAHRMTGRATVLGEDGKPILVGLPWRIVSSGDFNSDGRTDILWHNSSSNETQIWLMNDRNVIGRRTVLGENGKPMFVGLPWSIVGADDFNRDAACDILWHNKDTGESQIWFMREHSIAHRATVDVRDGGGNLIGLPWRIVPTNLPPSEQAPASPPVAPVQAFEGGWQTVTNQNGRYTLILRIENRGLNPMLYDTYITGQFLNTDGATQYNGILRGTIPKGTRTLIYEYAQPEIKASGKGQFTLSNDGNAITGNGTAGGATFTWNGTRAK